jgi:hypothetical protein
MDFFKICKHEVKKGGEEADTTNEMGVIPEYTICQSFNL